MDTVDAMNFSPPIKSTQRSYLLGGLNKRTAALNITGQRCAKNGKIVDKNLKAVRRMICVLNVKNSVSESPIS